MSHHRFTDLDRVIDDVHALFDAWDAAAALAPALDEDGSSVLRLAVHEWVANLVQHAAFPHGTEIAIRVSVDPEAVRCTVDDTSVGFDFAGQVDRQHAIFDAPAPSERGRGLLMLITCTEDLSFRPATAESRQSISFSVRAGGGMPALAAFFRPEDLADDFSLADSLDDFALGASFDEPDAFWSDALSRTPDGEAALPSGDGASAPTTHALPASDAP